ncbi:MAG: hypothetical protein COA94_00620 [Rickettsiales bacterium]|nr:MAG: hypothetical protein COA94_00620 [Rickettsiales bacterium]
MFKLDENDLIRSASYASVVIAIIIMVVKMYGWLATDSQSILASLVDSFLDISSSLINLIAIRVSLMPADDTYRFGYDKFQDLAIFSQSIFFFASSLFTMFSSGKALYIGAVPANVALGANVMYICIFLTFILVLYQSYVIRHTNSRIIAADKLHYFSDFLTNIAIVISLYLSATFWYLDALAGIGVSFYIMFVSYQLFRDAIHNLADEEFETEDRDRIIKIISSFSETKGIHELKTRSAGSKPFIQFHLELDGSLSLLEAHYISDRISDALIKEFPKAEITIHQDPEGFEHEVNYVERI